MQMKIAALAALFTAARGLEVWRAPKEDAAQAALLSLKDYGPSLTASLEKAKAAAKEAQEAAKMTAKWSEENNAVVTPAKAFEAEAKAAAKAAEDAMNEAMAITKATAKEAKKEAMIAAKEYYKEVQLAGIMAAKNAAADQAAAEKKMEVDAALAAGKAAEPYHQYILRGQKVIVEYQTRAQELAASSNALKSQGMQLAGSAAGYQANGYMVQANQIMMQAHTLFKQGDTMRSEALRLKAAANAINDALPAYQLAASAAAAAAADSANPAVLTNVFMPY